MMEIVYCSNFAMVRSNHRIETTKEEEEELERESENFTVTDIYISML
jgi:hypothetical protein